MAGKHIGGSVALDGRTTLARNRATVTFQPKIDKAYADGRQVGVLGGLEAANPHPAGSPANVAWGVGWTRSDAGDSWQYETGIPGV